MAQLEFNRDYIYKYMFKYLSEIYKVYAQLYKKYPERESKLLNEVMSIGNTKKVYEGYLRGLKDELLMKRKKETEEFIRSKVNKNAGLVEKYGHLWSAIENVLYEYKEIIKVEMALRKMKKGVPVYFQMAEEVIELADQLRLPEEERSPDYKSENIEETISGIYLLNKDPEINLMLLQANINYLNYVLGNENDFVSKLLGQSGVSAEDILKRSLFNDEELLLKIIEKGSAAIINYKDPFIIFMQKRNEIYPLILNQSDEINNTISVLNQLTGEMQYKIFGDDISPDATSTLRISDGIISGFEYNGTIAPPFTVYYGMYDRYYSFGEKTYPWGLPERWKTPPAGLNLNTPLDFCSTNDIAGGNSGSSIINRNGEVVGLAHDGNMESLGGDFIYYPVNNRTVAVDSRGLLASLKYAYKADALIDELMNSHR
jgi:hypothetical protein